MTVTDQPEMSNELHDITTNAKDITCSSDSTESVNCSKNECVIKVSECLSSQTTLVKSVAKKYYKWLLLVIYNVYLIFAIYKTWHKVCTGIIAYHCEKGL